MTGTVTSIRLHWMAKHHIAVWKQAAHDVEQHVVQRADRRVKIPVDLLPDCHPVGAVDVDIGVPEALAHRKGDGKGQKRHKENKEGGQDAIDLKMMVVLSVRSYVGPRPLMPRCLKLMSQNKTLEAPSLDIENSLLRSTPAWVHGYT